MKNIVLRNFENIRREIAPFNPVIIAVTKYGGLQNIVDAYQAGLRDFAESRVSGEVVEKINSLPEHVRNDSRFHLIGHLQTNKVKKAVANFNLIHSVDSLRLAQAISTEAQRIGKVQKILIQVNNASEVQKFGFSEKDLMAQFKEICELPGIEILGLMNMAPYKSTEVELEFIFKDLARIKSQIERTYSVTLPELSMGMSNDYVVAARTGATMLRIGSRLFNN